MNLTEALQRSPKHEARRPHPEVGHIHADSPDPFRAVWNPGSGMPLSYLKPTEFQELHGKTDWLPVS